MSGPVTASPGESASDGTSCQSLLVVKNRMRWR